METREIWDRQIRGISKDAAAHRLQEGLVREGRMRKKTAELSSAKLKGS